MTSVRKNRPQARSGATRSARPETPSTQERGHTTAARLTRPQARSGATRSTSTEALNPGSGAEDLLELGRRSSRARDSRSRGARRNSETRVNQGQETAKGQKARHLEEQERPESRRTAPPRPPSQTPRVTRPHRRPCPPAHGIPTHTHRRLSHDASTAKAAQPARLRPSPAPPSRCYSAPCSR